MNRAFVAMLLCAAVASAMTACGHGDEAGNAGGDNPSAGPAPKPNELPPLELRDETANLLLTWVDDHGDFHVTQKIADVPADRRDPVRVVVTTKREGTGELVYVADLRQKRSDSTYTVRTLTRAQWEDIGATKRKARLEALAPSQVPIAVPAPSAAANTEVSAIIYGAEWCGPCHEAERLLKSLGVHVSKKDIEKSPEAHREMTEKLRKANRTDGSIPVIDVMGKLFVGYSPVALKKAVDAARDKQPL